MVILKDIFIVHPSVFHDAFRADYTTQFRDSSKDFLNLLKDHKIQYNEKIGFTSGEVFYKLIKSKLENTKTIWIIPEWLVEIDFETYFEGSRLEIDESLIRLASKKCITNVPYIVSTKKGINMQGTSFPVCTPAQAISYYNHTNSLFKNK